MEESPSIKRDCIDFEVYLNGDTGFGYITGKRNGERWEEVEFFCGNQHYKTSIIFKDPGDIYKIAEFFNRVKEVRGELFLKPFEKVASKY